MFPAGFEGAPMTPDFRDARVLRGHVQRTMDFYHPRCIDPIGGFYHYFKDDGTVYNHADRHLVSSTRFIFNYAMAFRHFRRPEYLDGVRHGLRFLRNAHRQPATGGYAWEIRRDSGGTTVIDATNHCYGLAFVLLAYAQAVRAGLDEESGHLSEVFELVETHFWEPQHGLYADEANPDWTGLAPYRGQNANMHMCEALITAFEATGDARYLRRAEMLARHVTVRQAALAGDLVWEHYRSDWSVDQDYNKGEKNNLFRPWGFQPGHLTEWAKLLLILERHKGQLAGDSDWLAPRAQALFDAALVNAWDHEHGGIHYGFAPDGAICDPDKYFWVQAESLAAAALLASRTGDAKYWDWYDRLWRYCWKHFVDQRHGAWFRILTADNQKISDDKSPAGKTDYHTMGACYEVLRLLEN